MIHSHRQKKKQYCCLKWALKCVKALNDIPSVESPINQEGCSFRYLSEKSVHALQICSTHILVHLGTCSVRHVLLVYHHQK